MNLANLLIVEDNAAHLRALSDNFSDLGYDVEVASDGITGLQKAFAMQPDLIVLDIMLPGKNGYEICETLRAQGFTAPIIMLTAKDQEQDIVQGLELGADDYVVKPFRINELTARVKALLRRHQDPKQDKFAFGNFELDLIAHQLHRDGEQIDLTRKEYDLLKFFLQKPNCALTRNQIMKWVWGSRIIVTPRSVDRCVTTLRAKIEPEPSQPIYILTIRDIGYRFCKESA